MVKEKFVNEIPGLEHISGYKVTSNGDVYSYLKPTVGKGMIICDKPTRKLKPYLTSKGYLKVSLRDKNISLHRLVAMAFIPNPESKPQVNHIDGIKSNCKESNLEWCTNAENHKHKCENGLNVVPKGKKHYLHGKTGNKHHQSKCVVQLSLSLEYINKFGSAREAARELKIDPSGIIRCCNGQLKQTKGFKFLYYSDYIKL